MAHDPTGVDGAAAARRFAGLTYDRFRDRALDPGLSETEKMGSPDAFRAGFEEAILADFATKLPGLARPGAWVVDIGAGCGELTRRMIAARGAAGQNLVLVDSPEMLDLLPDAAHVTKIPGRFPQESAQALAAVLPAAGADVVVTYGVLQSVYFEANPFVFVDAVAALLAPGGAALVGDTANISKLRRFLASDAGRAYHRSYMRSDSDPQVPPFESDPTRLDDGVLVGLMLRMRAAGYDAYLLPQPASLPVSNRREDLLILRP